MQTTSNEFDDAAFYSRQAFSETCLTWKRHNCGFVAGLQHLSTPPTFVHIWRLSPHSLRLPHPQTLQGEAQSTFASPHPSPLLSDATRCVLCLLFSIAEAGLEGPASGRMWAEHATPGHTTTVCGPPPTMEVTKLTYTQDTTGDATTT